MCATSLRWAYDVTWSHRPRAGNSIICHFFFFFLLWSKDTQEISGARLPYRRRERRMFVIYSSARQLCYYHCTKKRTLFQLWKVSQVAILKVEHCSFMHLEFYSFFYKTMWFIFYFFFFFIWIFFSSPYTLKKQNVMYFQFFLKWTRYSKNKPQGFMKILTSYQMEKCSTFKSRSFFRVFF